MKLMARFYPTYNWSSMPHIIVGTAGHIDHGKTALVKALTGIDTDRLKEEKERGITIDLGFASLRAGRQHDDRVRRRARARAVHQEHAGRRRRHRRRDAGHRGRRIGDAADARAPGDLRAAAGAARAHRPHQDRRRGPRAWPISQRSRSRSSSKGSFLEGAPVLQGQRAHRRRASRISSTALRTDGRRTPRRGMLASVFRLPIDRLLHDEGLRRGRRRHADRRIDAPRGRGRGAAGRKDGTGPRHPGARRHRGRSARRPADRAEPSANGSRGDRARHGGDGSRASCTASTTFDVRLELLPTARAAAAVSQADPVSRPAPPN